MTAPLECFKSIFLKEVVKLLRSDGGHVVLAERRGGDGWKGDRRIVVVSRSWLESSRGREDAAQVVRLKCLLYLFAEGDQHPVVNFRFPEMALGRMKIVMD